MKHFAEDGAPADCRAHDFERPPLHAVFADSQTLARALVVLTRFMSSWIQRLRCRAELRRVELQLMLHISGERREVDHRLLEALFDVPHRAADLEDCGISPEQWAQLVLAAIVVRAVGGQVAIRPEAPSGEPSVGVGVYALDVTLPVEEIPPWAPNRSKNRSEDRSENGTEHEQRQER